MVEHPRIALRRIPPDPVQFQVILGSLLGDGRIVGVPTDRRLRIAHSERRLDYVRWKYERLGSFAGDPPKTWDGVARFETVTHPVFDDLSRVFADHRGRHDVMSRLLRPLGLAVWLADVGRLELRANAFLPAQRELVLAS